MEISIEIGLLTLLSLVAGVIGIIASIGLAPILALFGM
jgi:hypothetical protein